MWQDGAPEQRTINHLRPHRTNRIVENVRFFLKKKTGMSSDSETVKCRVTQHKTTSLCQLVGSDDSLRTWKCDTCQSERDAMYKRDIYCQGACNPDGKGGYDLRLDDCDKDPLKKVGCQFSISSENDDGNRGKNPVCQAADGSVCKPVGFGNHHAVNWLAGGSKKRAGRVF